MKGYKGMSKDMKCREMQYEVGKTYHVDGEVELCSNGLHFCERLKDVFGFYSRDRGSRYFEVYAGGQIVCDGIKSAASELTILRELTDIEVNRCIYGDGSGADYNDDGNGYNGYGDNYNGYAYNGDGYGYNDYGNNYNDYGNGYGNGYNGYSTISRILIYKGE